MATLHTPLVPRLAAGVDTVVPSERVLVKPAPPPPRRRRRLGLWLGGVVAGAVIGGFLVSGYYETATLGQRLDATVERGEDAVRGVADGMQQSAQQVAEAGAAGMDRAVGALSDASVTASIKTALAADPSLSALKIDVSTRQGVVTLKGPAPDVDARERATVLARAPQGVIDVKNELVLPQAAASASGAVP